MHLNATYKNSWNRKQNNVCVTLDSVSRLSRLIISKSEGPDLLHPRVVYEIRHEI